MNLCDKSRHLYYCKAKLAVNKLLFMENVRIEAKLQNNMSPGQGSYWRGNVMEFMFHLGGEGYCHYYIKSHLWQ